MQMSSEGQPVRLRFALLGTGIFARGAYVSLLRQFADEVELTAVWSRSASGTDAVVQSVREFAPHVQGYNGEDALDAILQRDDIHAVLVVLPVQVSLQVTERALKAGKHVLQEKPIAPTVAAAKQLLQWYGSNGGNLVWNLAENYRFEEVFLAARRSMGGIGGVVKFDFIADMPMNTSNKYYNSTWRRDTVGCPGGFVTDSCVHFVAALRLLASCCGEAVMASAIARGTTDQLPPPDTVVGHVKFEDGTMASISFSLSAAHVRFSLAAVGTKGSLECVRGGWGGSRGEYRLVQQLQDMSEPQTLSCPFTGLDGEMRAFIAQVRASSQRAAADARDAESRVAAAIDDDVIWRSHPRQGVQDLALIEALLKSSERDGQPVTVEAV